MAPHRASPSTSRVLRASVSSASGFFTAVCWRVRSLHSSSCSSCPRSLSRYEPELTSLRDGPYVVRDRPRDEYCGAGPAAASAKAPRESSRALREIDRGIHTERRRARSPRRAATRSSTRGPYSPTPSAARASATTGTTTPTRSRTSARRAAAGRPPPASATARRRGARSSASSTSSGRAGCSTSTCAPPRALRSELCSLCVSLLLNATHTQDRHGCTEALSLARLSRLSESRRLSTGNRPGRATPSCPSPPCPRTPTCRTRCPRRRRRRTG